MPEDELLEQAFALRGINEPVFQHDVDNRKREDATRCRAYVDHVPYLDGIDCEMYAGDFGAGSDTSGLSYQGSAVW